MNLLLPPISSRKQRWQTAASDHIATETMPVAATDVPYFIGAFAKPSAPGDPLPLPPRMDDLIEAMGHYEIPSDHAAAAIIEGVRRGIVGLSRELRVTVIR